MRPLEKVIDVEEIIFKIVDGAKVDGIWGAVHKTHKESYRVYECKKKRNGRDKKNLHDFFIVHDMLHSLRNEIFFVSCLLSLVAFLSLVALPARNGPLL